MVAPGARVPPPSASPNAGSLAASFGEEAETIASKRRRRPNAGPPPAPKRPEVVARQEKALTTPKRRSGEPVLPSFRNVMGRSAFAGGGFFLMLIFVFRDPPGSAILITIVLLAIVTPMYVLLDRVLYRRRHRRWEARQGVRAKRP